MLRRHKDRLLSYLQTWLRPTWWQRIFRHREIRRRAIKLRFALVGASATIIDWGLLFGLHLLGWPSVAANFISTTAGFSFSFTLNKNFTFKTRDANVGREIFLYIGITLVGIWIFQPIIITLVERLLESTSLPASLALAIGKILATGVTLIWNYLLYSKVVFHRKDRKS